MSPTMIFTTLQLTFPEFKITKYGRIDDRTIWFEKEGTNGRLLFTFLSATNYILKGEFNK